jgi:acetolactate synthase-1/2/3 large subunit
MPPSVDTNGANGDSVSTKVTPFRYTASAAFIDTLIAAGVKYLFVNLGTDHPGLVEVFAYASMTKRKDFPRVMTCPNEMVALTIAHSYAQITGQCQAVLLHVETGTLAMAGALHNAAKARVPVLIWAGASPSTIEGEVPGGRTEFIQFQQEYASHL